MIRDQKLPKILDDITTLSACELRLLLASFPLENIDHSWVRHIPMDGLDSRFKQRLQLGVAGYRMINVFKVATRKLDICDAESRAFSIIRELANHPVDWEIAAITRSARFSAAFPRLNSVLSDLLYHSITEQEMTRLIGLKAIPKACSCDESCHMWSNWESLNQLFIAREPIFPSSQ